MTITIPSWLAIPALIPIAATLMNLFFHWRTPEGWARFCIESPRLALLIRACRRIGIDPAGLLRDIRDWTRGFRKQGLQLGDATETPRETLVLLTSVDVITAVAAGQITTTQAADALKAQRLANEAAVKVATPVEALPATTLVSGAPVVIGELELPSTPKPGT